MGYYGGWGMMGWWIGGLGLLVLPVALVVYFAWSAHAFLNVHRGAGPLVPRRTMWRTAQGPRWASRTPRAVLPRGPSGDSPAGSAYCARVDVSEMWP